MIKKFTQFFVFVLLSFSALAQGTETFTNIPATGTSYGTRLWTGDNGLDWNATDARNDQTINGKAIAIRNGNVNCQGIPNGIGLRISKFLVAQVQF